MFCTQDNVSDSKPHAGTQSSELLTSKASLTGEENKGHLEKTLTFKFRKQQEYKEFMGRRAGLGTAGVNFRFVLRHL